MSQAAATAGHARRRVRPDDDRWGWKEESRALFRALAGGSIVGMPLLYTMEMWQHGVALSEWHLLAVLALTLLVNFGFSLVSGFRTGSSVVQALSESIEAVGLGILFSILVLTLIGELSPSTSPVEMAGKVLLEAVPVSIGVSFANSQVRDRSRTGEEEGEEKEEARPSREDRERMQLQADLRDAGAAVAGSTVFALNIAPTEEVIQIAARLTPWHQLGILITCLVLCYVILFASGFEEHQVHLEGLLQHPVAETIMTTTLSLGIAFALLMLLGQRETMTELSTAVATTLTLGLPAVVGGAAGRLIA